MSSFAFDHHLTERIRVAGQSTLPLWIFLASYGMWGFVLIALVLVAIDRASMFMVLLPIMFTHLLALGLQQVVRRERPPIVFSKIVMWRRTPSFPSAHSAGSMAFATAIGIAILPSGSIGVVLIIFMFLFALAIGISRIVVGVHYLSDVLMGFCFGTVVTGIFLAVLS